MKAVIHEGPTSTRRRYEVSKEGMTTISGRVLGDRNVSTSIVYICTGLIADE